MQRFFALAWLALLLAACTREGPPGPRGPQGPVGPPGAGLDYVIIDVTANPPDWQAFGQPGSPDFQYFVEFNAPDIDAYAFDNAMILGYLIDSDGTAYTLPNTVSFGDYVREFSMYFGVGYLGFVVKDSDLQTTAPEQTIFYRVYVVSPRAKKGLPDNPEFWPDWWEAQGWVGKHLSLPAKAE